MSASEFVVVARFGAPHGVRGEIRLKSFTAEPRAVLDYGPLTASDDRQFTLTSGRPAAGKSHDMLVVRVKGIASRDDAEPLNNLELTIPRSRLPKADEGDFYHADLIGLRAETNAGETLGMIAGILNHGAGDILEIAPETGASILVPFTRAAVPIVKVGEGLIVVDPDAAGLLPDGDEPGTEHSAEAE